MDWANREVGRFGEQAGGKRFLVKGLKFFLEVFLILFYKKNMYFIRNG